MTGVSARNADGEGRRVTLAAVAGAHGVKGDVRLKLFAESLESLKLAPALLVGGTERRLDWARAAGKQTVAHFAGVDDRAGAEALRGALVEVERSALPPLGEGEYYHADLIGLPCVDRDGARVGRVATVENFGAGDLLDVELEGGGRSLIPFKPGIADMDQGRIVLDPDFLA